MASAGSSRRVAGAWRVAALLVASLVLLESCSGKKVTKQNATPKVALCNPKGARTSGGSNLNSLAATLVKANFNINTNSSIKTKTKRRPGKVGRATPGGSFTPVGIRYHGGPVMASTPINIYILWLGGITDLQKSTTRIFINSLRPSADPTNTVARWWRTNTYYYQTDPQASVAKTVSIAGEYSVTSPDSSWGFSGKTLETVNTAVSKAIPLASWPTDVNGVYG